MVSSNQVPGGDVAISSDRNDPAQDESLKRLMDMLKNAKDNEVIFSDGDGSTEGLNLDQDDGDFDLDNDDDDSSAGVPDFDAMMDEDDDDDDYYDDEEEEDDFEGRMKSNNSRWSSLDPRSKERMSFEKRRLNYSRRPKPHPNKPETKLEKKRRLLQFMRRAQMKRKREARVQRPIPFDMRTPLTALVPGSKMRGTVISLTNFGAYIDVGTECDGLLHISQISNTDFIRHPSDVMKPGDEIEVIIKRKSNEQKKLHLTLLEEKEENTPDQDEFDDEDRIPLKEISVDDELWGIIQRVTDYGSYVELGAAVTGFLHFMDHPYFGEVAGAHPSTYMEAGQRVRVWVSDVDLEKNRIKLTAKRPRDLPGPRRSLD